MSKMLYFFFFMMIRKKTRRTKKKKRVVQWIRIYNKYFLSLAVILATL